MKFYIVPNWNNSFPVKSFKSVEDLYDYADRNNIIVSLVSDNFYHCKKHKFTKDSVIYVGW